MLLPIDVETIALGLKKFGIMLASCKYAEDCQKLNTYANILAKQLLMKGSYEVAEDIQNQLYRKYLDLPKGDSYVSEVVH